VSASLPLPPLEALIAPFLPDCEELALDLLHLPQPHVPAGVDRPAGQDLLTAMCRDQFASGGKRLRALLTPALVAAANGPVEAARVFGAAVELIHNGTLVHDDIQDGDTLRRGRPTLWTQFGVAQGINAGDALLMGAVAAVLRSGVVPEDLRASLGGLLAEALCETIRGQVADLALRDLPEPSLQDVESVHLAKTGPLFSACFVGAVRLLRRDLAAEQAAYVLGREIGLAFQIRDDLLDLLGTKGRGDAGADLREGKPTWPVLVALRDAPGAEADGIRALLKNATQGSPPSDADVSHAVAWVREVGGEDTARRHLSETLDSAKSAALQAFSEESAVVALALCERLARLDG
jgi:geranylgeranyl pyrophosphate synthase